MEDFIAWVADNKLLSGAGTALIAFLGRLIFKGMNNSSTSQKIRPGSNSTNVQVGRDMNIGSGSKADDVEQK